MQPIAASVRLARLDHAEADLLDFRDDLRQALSLQVLGVEYRRADQELEAAFVLHPAWSLCGMVWKGGLLRSYRF